MLHSTPSIASKVTGGWEICEAWEEDVHMCRLVRVCVRTHGSVKPLYQHFTATIMAIK